MALTEDGFAISSVNINVESENITIVWRLNVSRDGVAFSSAKRHKDYTAENSSDLDTDVAPGLATKLKSIFGWT